MSRQYWFSTSGGNGAGRLTQAASAESTGDVCAGSRLFSAMRVGRDHHRCTQGAENFFIQHARAQTFAGLLPPRGPPPEKQPPPPAPPAAAAAPPSPPP